jgi:hypothetical protein
MGTELTGIVSPGGAKMKADIGTDAVVFRAAIKMEVPFEEITAETRGTLLVLHFRGHTVELGAGAKANALASQIRSPPSRMDRLGIPFGATAALAGPFDAAFRGELNSRTDLATGVPKVPVDHLFLLAAQPTALDAIPRLMPLLAATGTLWVVHPTDQPDFPASKVAAAAKLHRLVAKGAARFDGTMTAQRFGKGS